ncbi:MAG: ribosome silencing factor [Pseudomonadales bacterium]
MSQTTDLKQLVIDALEDLKGNDIKCLDVRKQTDIADYMVIASGTSSRHVAALVNNVVAEASEVGIKPKGVEGQEAGDWILIDLVDVVVHVMNPDAREFYDLERLWSLEPGKDQSKGQPLEH